MGPIELSIVMPCLNEDRALRSCIRSAKRFLRASRVTGEILISDNGSTDDSLAIAAEEGVRIVHAPQPGYGSALDRGIRTAKGRFVIMGDSDGSYDFEQVQPFLDALRDGADFVLGNRFQGEIFPGAMPWKNRVLGNPALSFLGRLLFGSSLGDFQCGLRALPTRVYPRLDLQSPGMEYASEMVARAELLGLNVKEVPTTLRPDKRPGASHLRPWRDGLRHLSLMLSLWWDHRRLSAQSLPLEKPAP